MTRRLRLGLALLVLTTVASCAYYNIFWMAESDYDKALEVGGYDFWDPYAQPPLKGDSDRLVTSCIERCGKLLLLHPNSRWVDDALFIMGNCFVIRGEHQNALRKYDEILRLYPSSQFAPMARYMKAYTLIRDGSTQQGLALLRTISEESKQGDVRQRAVFVLGRAALARNDYDRAIPFFETYLAEYPDGAKADRVRLHLAECLSETGESGRVISVLEPLAKKRGDEGLEAALKVGEAYREVGENDKAIEIFNRLMKEAVEDSVIARAKMETARTMAARGEAEESIAVLDEAFEVATGQTPELRDEIVFTKGMVNEKNLQNFDTAITAYDKIEKSQSQYGKMAKRRSRALKDLLELRGALNDTIPDSPEEEAGYRFKLGETYVDDLGLWQKAFAEFKTVADSLSGTGFGPPAMLRTATMLESQGDTLAEEYYQRVLEADSGSVYANFARSKLGLPLVDVVIVKPVVWDDGQVVGPFLPASPPDSLPLMGPELPPMLESQEVPPDSAVGRRQSHPDSARAVGRRPEPTGILFPQSEPIGVSGRDSTGRGAGSDTSGAAPADSTRHDERQQQ